MGKIYTFEELESFNLVTLQAIARELAGDFEANVEGKDKDTLILEICEAQGIDAEAPKDEEQPEPEVEQPEVETQESPESVAESAQEQIEAQPGELVIPEVPKDHYPSGEPPEKTPEPPEEQPKELEPELPIEKMFVIEEAFWCPELGKSIPSGHYKAKGVEVAVLLNRLGR